VSNHDESCGGWRIAFRHPGALAGAFLAGGILAFGYSYTPLHGAKNWKIDYQASRLESQREKLAALDAKLAAAGAEAADAARLEESRPRREELDEAQAKLKGLEKKLAALEAENSKLTRSRDSWRSRHAAVEKELDELNERKVGKVRQEGKEGNAQVGTPLAALAPEAAAPDSPAPAAAPALPVEQTVLEGSRWTSPDGGTSFTLVAAEEDHATLELAPDGSSVRVEAGSNIRVGDSTSGSYRVTVMEIEDGRAIRVSAVPETSDLLLAPLGSAAAPAPM
jgi:hypothetical protein